MSSFRRNLMMFKKGGLPPDYQAVEYIESTGTQYITLPILLKNAYGYDIVFQTTGDVSNTYNVNGVFGTNNAGQDIKNWYNTNASTTQIHYSFALFGKTLGNSQEFDRTENYTLVHRIIAKDGELTFDGNHIASFDYPTTISSRYNIMLFGAYSNWTPSFYSKERVFKLQVFDIDGKIILDFIPCFRISDGVIGMYDLISEQFYANEGEGTLLKGSDATPPIPRSYQKVVYIESDGNAYIDTGYVPKIKPRAVFSVAIRDNNIQPIIGLSARASSPKEFALSTTVINIYQMPYYDYGRSLGRYTAGGQNPQRWYNFDAGDKCYTDGKLAWTATDWDFSQNTLSICLFAGSAGFNKTYIHGSHIALKTTSIYDGDKLVRNLIPCYHRSSGTIGMYDSVNNRFYTNAGSGSFIKGQDIQ